MTLRIAINGFGRIGRLVLRALLESGHTDIEIVAINDLADASRLAHLLKYDSVHGSFPGDIDSKDGAIFINGQPIPTFRERDPQDLPWKELAVDLVMECSGFFLTQALSAKHLRAGARRVLLSAPAKDDIKTVVYGINHDIINENDQIISNASCTTNALAPLVQVLDQAYGLKSGLMTTIHAYTGGQNLVDGLHKDAYRGRAAALSMVPTTTGATSAIGKILPHLDGRLDGVSLRVPTPNVSAIDLCVVTEKPASSDDVRAVFKKAAQGDLKNILGYIEDKVVSTDMNHNPRSAILVADQVLVTHDNLIRVFAWYDNEWGFSNRMLDTARVMGKFL